MSFWNTVSHWGTTSGMNAQETRYVILSNRASILVSGFTFCLFLTGLSYFGLIYSIRLALAFSILFLFPLALNKMGFTIASRLIFSIIISIASVVISVVDKFDYFQMEELQYFEFRLTLLSATLFPFILFSIQEKKYWITALIANLACIIFFDPIHQLFDVGYYDLGFTGPSYYFFNFMTVGAFLIIAGSAYFLKSSFEKVERENEQLIVTLSEQKEIIEQKREILALENSKLNENLIDKNNQLIKTNQELVQHNNDLQQFSYTISHNLRGPVASLNGLLSLFKEDQVGEHNQELMPHFKNSIASLDHTIKDLGNIIDVRNGLTRLRESIAIKNEIRHILTLLDKEIKEGDIQIDLLVKDETHFVSVKPMVTSILYNLISNAIKYRALDRQPKITIKVSVDGDYAQLSVMDNGLGIDLDRYKDKLFGIYKRFHNHVEGKGLGLFLVKLQAESLGGHVEVSSTPAVGTNFLIFIRVQEKAD